MHWRIALVQWPYIAQSRICLLSNTWQDLGVRFLFALYDSESVQGGLEIMRESWANESKLECDLRRAT